MILDLRTAYPALDVVAAIFLMLMHLLVPLFSTMLSNTKYEVRYIPCYIVVASITMAECILLVMLCLVRIFKGKKEVKSRGRNMAILTMTSIVQLLATSLETSFTLAQYGSTKLYLSMVSRTPY
jgi:type II secretory pathway component PulF